MTSDIAVAAEGLGKQYRLGEGVNTFRTLRDSLGGLARRRSEPPTSLFWALDDVSFDVAQGEAVGVIGANGAGKTTLLKILSRITPPTRGRAIVKGRVGSLLEVGTGFHPELTGRENIFLNGAILGMRRAEIVRKLDEIVAFAELDRFLDTPVKRYSSGMYVRLAFAVAAHLESNVLLVDEVLAVGDLSFQRKCLGKMQEQTRSEGRTVLFVSHNLGAIKALTSRSLWLDHGLVRALGPTDTVYQSYVEAHAEGAESGTRDLSDLTSGRGGKYLPQEVTFEWVAVRNADGEPAEAHFEGEPITIEIGLRCRVPRFDRELEVACRVKTMEDVLVFVASSGLRPAELEEGLYRTSFSIEPNVLTPGVYELELTSITNFAQDLARSAITFQIEANPEPDSDIRHSALGVISVDYAWTAVEPATDARTELPRGRRSSVG
jgi:lipopolysaccharide transport system ATP-binding protein